MGGRLSSNLVTSSLSQLSYIQCIAARRPRGNLSQARVTALLRHFSAVWALLRVKPEGLARTNRLS